jgi:hypothetical protein
MNMKNVKDKSKTKQTRYQHFLERNRKNQLLFYRKLRSDAMFFGCLDVLLKEYGNFQNPKDASSLLYSFIDPTKRYKLGSIKEQASLIVRAFRDMDGRNEKRRIKFLGDIERFLQKFNLGFEWTSPLVALVLKHNLCLPYENLYIETSRYDDAPGRVILTLNPDTSPEDIKFAFDRVRKLQKQLQPNIKPIKLTKDALSRFYEVMYYDLAKYIEAVKANWEQLDSYEQRIYDYGIKHNAIEKAIETINNPAPYERPMRKPRFKYNRKATDKIVAKKIASITPHGSVSRILSNIRQKRKRQKA